MGCDGGTIPKRDELVRTKKKKEQASKESTNAAKWNHCRLSQSELRKPIVADMAGNLYNKESVIEYLLDKSKFEKAPDCIKSLKDVKELNLVANPSFNSNKSENGGEFSALNKPQWICPITGLEMNGTFKFYFLFSCGCVISERAFKTITSSNLRCLKCEKTFSETDLFILNPNEEELQLNEKKMKARKEAALAKKSTSKASSSNESSSSSSASIEKQTNGTSSSSKKRNLDSVTDSAAAQAGTDGGAVKNGKKVKTIQDDPNVSDVYKSLFTSSDKAKNQQKAHWVTFNPQYF